MVGGIVWISDSRRSGTKKGYLLTTMKPMESGRFLYKRS